ncbi:hypothetical protein NT6N_31090 [Oceaniferula spumae]|uniref:DUF2752 domain-containing protein n=1 Tax=Oceaniferula spumae TaxID=2979115 RepID=A0AAT9FQ79_9BACT
MKRRQLWPLLPPLTAIGLAVIFLSIANWQGSKGTECGVRKFTGLHCPGCGGTRCAQDLVAGNWLEALDHNAILACGALLFVALCIYLIVRITILGKPAPAFPNLTGKWIWFGIGGIFLFTVLRNIPAWPFNLLAP